ncbi:protein of unknown function [Amycolatopsis pretoriensis]|uniref:DUF4436 domain-containing protein n=1 Tax=Amycolatopsis pretoriensis TaxID=218821 RepID=A0A1H5RLB7_9PSEU|nr:DUF4436 family protein [Amycolatopsis pretoriensis]SEF38498.1 protein of unknown function [Amycolatopsis pretoriensis]
MNPKSSRWGQSRPLRTIVAVVAVVLVTAGSLVVYLVERADGQVQIVMGDTSAPDRVDVNIFVQKVDAAAQELSAQVEMSPQGALADESGSPRQDLTIFTNGTKGDTLSFKAGKSPSTADVKLALNDGIITDYPFDSYKIDVGVAVQTATGAVPVSVTLVNTDAFFKLKTHDEKAEDGALVFTADAERSTGTWAFALFMMLFMWLLSLAAVTAAWFVVGNRRGLLWPPMSFMGALLFALVPLRNAAPGQPPIGSVIDFGSFFIAEGLISLSLIVTVIVGYRVERANEREEKAAKVAVETPDPSPPALPLPEAAGHRQGAPVGAQPWQDVRR